MRHKQVCVGVLMACGIFACQPRPETLTLSQSERGALLGGIRPRPVFVDGQLYGSQLRLRPDAALKWPASWREDDDTIVAINGQSHPNGELIMDQLRSAAKVELTVEATGGSRRTVVIRFDTR